MKNQLLEGDTFISVPRRATTWLVHLDKILGSLVDWIVGSLVFAEAVLLSIGVRMLRDAFTNRLVRRVGMDPLSLARHVGFRRRFQKLRAHADDCGRGPTRESCR